MNATQANKFSIGMIDLKLLYKYRKIVNNTHYLTKKMCYNINEDILPLYRNDTHCATLEGWFHLGKYISFRTLYYTYIYCIRYLITQHVHQKITYIKAGLMYVRGWNMKVSFRNKTRK